MKYGAVLKTLAPLVLAAAAVTTSGCASLTHSGYAEYTVKPFLVNETTVCCEVVVKNGKEVGQVEAHIVKEGSNYTIDIKETSVAAFEGQKAVSTMASEVAGKVADSITGIVTKVPQ